MPKTSRPLVPVPEIQQRIHVVRGRRVMLDADLARFYGVGTRDLNKAVRRNAGRFPEDFSFILTKEEFGNLMFQPGTSSSGYGGRRKPLRVFTEQGVAMLGSALRSMRAVTRLGLSPPLPNGSLALSAFPATASASAPVLIS